MFRSAPGGARLDSSSAVSTRPQPLGTGTVTPNESEPTRTGCSGRLRSSAGALPVVHHLHRRIGRERRRHRDHRGGVDELRVVAEHPREAVATRPSEHGDEQRPSRVRVVSGAHRNGP